MDLDKLYEILADTTVQLRKGEVVHGTPKLVAAIDHGDAILPGGVVTIEAMPAVTEAAPDLDTIDLELLVVGVDRARAEKRRAEFIAVVQGYPNLERLAGGPSYIEVGAEIGNQGAAFQMFALGKTLGLWDVITPASIGVTGPKAAEMAGLGFIMMTGYKTGAGPA